MRLIRHQVEAEHLNGIENLMHRHRKFGPVLVQIIVWSLLALDCVWCSVIVRLVGITYQLLFVSDEILIITMNSI